MTNRLERFWAVLTERGLDAALLAAPEGEGGVSVRYLTGFTGSSSYLWVSRKGTRLLTDSRYIEVAQAEARGYVALEHADDYVDTILAIAKEEQAVKVGYDPVHLTVATFDRWRAKLPEITWEPLGDALEVLRIVKEPGEAGLIRKAAHLASEALSDLIDQVPGMTERAFATRLERRMVDLGLEGLSFPTIVASGARGSLPHGVPSDKVMVPGDLVTVDFGGTLGGYASDETLTFAVGEVRAELRRIYDVVREAEAAGVAKAAPGITASELDAACRQVVDAAGYGSAFSHGAGHGVGLAVHERPFLTPRPRPGRDDVLRPGMTVTVEPGIYLPGMGGCRLEDLLLITGDGSERLSALPKTWRSV